MFWKNKKNETHVHKSSNAKISYDIFIGYDPFSYIGKPMLYRIEEGVCNECNCLYKYEERILRDDNINDLTRFYKEYFEKEKKNAKSRL